MLGEYYVRREELVRTGQEPVEAYARELLAEVLNRAQSVHAAFWRVWEADSKPELEAARELLVQVVNTFLEDVEEARIRGIRARLFSRGCLGSEGVLDAACVMPDDRMEDLGGELVRPE